MSLHPNSRSEVRKKGYKTDVDAEEARQRGEDNSVEIKKHLEGLLNDSFPQQSQQVSLCPSQTAGLQKKLETIPLMVRGVWSDDANAQHEATT